MPRGTSRSSIARSLRKVSGVVTFIVISRIGVAVSSLRLPVHFPRQRAVSADGAAGRLTAAMKYFCRGLYIKVAFDPITALSGAGCAACPLIPERRTQQMAFIQIPAPFPARSNAFDVLARCCAPARV